MDISPCPTTYLLVTPPAGSLAALLPIRSATRADPYPDPAHPPPSSVAGQCNVLITVMLRTDHIAAVLPRCRATLGLPPEDDRPAAGRAASGGYLWGETMSSRGSKIFIAEAWLTPSQVTYRLATGPGYVTAGGQPRCDAGVLPLLGWDVPVDAITPRTHDMLGDVIRSFGRMAAELRRVRSFEMGTLS